jgi:thioredoxin-like negative regulator of GroEL
MLLWKVFIKRNVVKVYLEMFIASSFPKPSSDYQDADDYLTEVMDEQNNTDAVRMEAAKTYGYMRALYETQQVVGALQMSSAIKAAMMAYEKNYNFN